MPVRVPVAVRSLTLNISGNRTPSIWTESFFNDIFRIAAGIWHTAQVSFEVVSFDPNVEVELLNPTSQSCLIPPDQEYICSRFRATRGISLLLANAAASREPAASGVGGVAVAAFRACLLAHGSNQRTVGVYLAHEFGHLLGLRDIYTGTGDNLMYGALGTGIARLDPPQCTAARRAARLLH